MIVFSEKVQPTFTSSDHNVIIVKDYEEVFFDVFELEINGNKFVAEKVSDHNGSPVVTIPIENDGKKYNIPFILEKGDKFEIHYNKDAQKTYEPVKVSSKNNDTNILELVETKIQKKAPLFEVPNIEIDKYKNKEKSKVNRLNDDHRQNIVSESYTITESIKDQISEQYKIVFSEKVQPTFTSSDHNVIIVEDYNEIFFDVFELYINGNKFVAEKVSDYNGSPVITVPIEDSDKKYNVPCILEKGDRFELYYNKDAQKTYKPVKKSSKTKDINLLELVETKIQEKVPLFEVPDIEKAVDNIKSIKESAASYLERMRLKYLDEQKREIDKYENKKKGEIKKLNDDYRQNMVSEFHNITESIKDQISEQNNKERDQYNDFINESFNQYCQELDQKIGEDYQSAIKLFESKIDILTDNIFAEKIQSIFESKVDDLEKTLSSKEALFKKEFSTSILELVEAKIQEKVPLFEIPDIEKAVDNIKSIKESAASHLDRMRLEYLDEQKREIDKYEKKKKSEIKKLRQNMVSEFRTITESIKNEISDQNNKERDQCNDFINESLNQYCDELDQKVGEDYQSAIKLFESKIDTLTDNIFAEKIQNIFESKVEDLEKILYSKEALFEKEFSTKFSDKFNKYSEEILENVESKSKTFNDRIENLAERYENAITSLQESNIETNDLITKNTNRALSKIGNVKTILTNKIDEDLSKLQESTKEIESDLRTKLSKHKSYIKKYFGDKVSILETKFTDISEDYRDNVIDLIHKSEEKLLNEISKIDRELPTVILKEAKDNSGDNSEVSLEDIRKELENNISNKFSKEIVSLKRLIEMSSGGGSVAQQFANGGVIDGDLVITGSISASSFLGISGTSGTGGGTLSADSIIFNTQAGITPGVGELTWNADEESLDYGVNSDVTLQIGQEQLIHVKAEEDIKNGQAVYASGASGTGSGNIKVRLFRANAGGIDELYFIGIATEDIATNEFGFVTTFGKVRSVEVANTRASDDPQALSANNEGWDIGTILYVSPAEAGKFTQTKPVAPDKDIPVVMILSENGNRRTFFTRYEHGYHLSEIHDVLYNEPISDGDLLTWNNTISAWENQPSNLGTAAILDVGTTANKVVQLDASARLPAVDASQLTNLPSGATQLSDLSDVNTSTATNRNVLIGDGVDFESRALVEADISDLGTYLTSITGESLSDLSDVTTTGTQLDAIKTKVDGIEASADVTPAWVPSSDPSYATETYVDTEVSNLVDSAPGALDTLNELAAALGDDDNFATTITNNISTKLPLSGGTITGDIVMSGSETVDGRDLSVDGAKLDGIEAGADVTDAANVTSAGALMDSEVTNLDQVKAFDSTDYAPALGADDNYVTDAEKVVIGNTSGINTGDQDLSSYQLQPSEGAFVDGDKTKLDGVEAGADVTDATNVTAAGALMDSEVTNLADVKAFDPTDYAPALGADDNYVTDAEKIVIGNTSGINTGDQDLSSYQLQPSEGAFVDGDKTKLDGIESNATADQTAAEIRTLVDSATDSNVFTDADHTKLNGIESSADVTPAWVPSSDPSYATETYVDTEVANLVDSAPGTLDTLNELAAALGDDANFSTTIASNISTKLPLSGGTITGNIIMSGTETVDGRDLSVDGAKLDGIEANADVTDAANVAAAGALMDSEVTNLAQVKAFDSSDYAPALGADDNYVTDAEKIVIGNTSGTNTGDQDLSAYQLQPSEGAFVDGDKTKLDGIEAAATADQTAAEIRTLVDSATDSNVFTDADHTKLDGIETGADVTDTANVTSAGALMDSEVTNLEQVKAFDSSDYATSSQGALADSALQSTDIDTLTELNTIVTDATLIDTADSRLSDSRACDNTFDDAATARANLGLGNVENTSDATKFNNLIGPQTLTSSASVSWDCNSGRSAVLTMAHDVQLQVPTNLPDGHTASLSIIQDDSGGRELTLATGMSIMTGNLGDVGNMSPGGKAEVSVKRVGTDYRIFIVIAT